MTRPDRQEWGKEATATLFAHRVNGHAIIYGTNDEIVTRIASALAAAYQRGWDEAIEAAMDEAETFIHMKWPGDQKHEDAACDELLERIRSLTSAAKGGKG